MKRLCALLIFGFLFVNAAAAQFVRGSTVYVALKTIQLKSSTGFFAGNRGALAYGEAVTVLQTKGKWAEVRSASRSSLSGWTHAANLTSRRISSSGAATTSGELALAGKGFSQEVENAYRVDGKLDYADVDRVETQAVSEQELQSFLAEGHLSMGDAE
ncbi:MAG: hypothetical protein LBK27_07620 [Treponema sp.]|jgi:uncharacterized protein YgiM (DUF1202 family)|nr:hypothetical protein [Treponema sp.]